MVSVAGSVNIQGEGLDPHFSACRPVGGRVFYDCLVWFVPVSVAFQVVKGFRFYKGGVYTSDTCGHTETDVTHAVLAVGYGVEDGIPYWLIKNSWGKRLGS
ncbi:unnamed protein product [Musa acuminata subsp. burmannicoides]